MVLTVLAGAGCSDGVHSGNTDAQTLGSIATTTTVAPTTTQAPSQASRDVTAAVRAYWTASHACGQTPATCDPTTFTAGQGGLRQTVEDYRKQLIGAKQHLAAPQPEDGSYVSVLSVLIDPVTSATATTQECVFDGSPLMGVGSNGKDVLVSDASVSHQLAHTFYLENGTWLAGEEQVAPAGTAQQCDDTPNSVPVTFIVPGS
jgi:hypothetical protein